MTGFDVIGDVHGHADALTALLRELGYGHRGGAGRDPTRTAVFVGDLVDRGPDQLEVLRTVHESGKWTVAKGGKLIAYGWDGQPTLVASADRLVKVQP